MAKQKEDGTYKKSSNEGRQAAGKTRKPKETIKKMENALKNKRGIGGKRI